MIIEQLIEGIRKEVAVE